MTRFDWLPTVELEPGVTYIPAAVDDNGRERMFNCRCGTVPIVKEDIEGEIICNHDESEWWGSILPG